MELTQCLRITTIPDYVLLNYEAQNMNIDYTLAKEIYRYFLIIMQNDLVQ